MLLRGLPRIDKSTQFGKYISKVSKYFLLYCHSDTNPNKYNKTYTISPSHKRTDTTVKSCTILTHHGGLWQHWTRKFNIVWQGLLYSKMVWLFVEGLTWYTRILLNHPNFQKMTTSFSLYGFQDIQNIWDIHIGNGFHLQPPLNDTFCKYVVLGVCSCIWLFLFLAILYQIWTEQGNWTTICVNIQDVGASVMSVWKQTSYCR